MCPPPLATAAPSDAALDRDSWLAAALEVLVTDGIEAVKIAPLASRLGISRGSFYWHFRNRADLTEALLTVWAEKNTAAVLRAAEARAANLTEAVLAIFDLWVDESRFDPRLDFSVREWGRRDDDVARRVAEADAVRVAALAQLFARHGSAAEDAFIRARVLYFTQIGYYALGVQESLTERWRLAPAYLRVHMGIEPDPEVLAARIDGKAGDNGAPKSDPRDAS